LSLPKFVTLGGKRFAWREVLEARKQQRQATPLIQPALFELKDDTRPASERDAATRYQQPSLLPLMKGEPK
jgi:hypothetical protein